MENRVWDQKVRRKANAKQNTYTHNTRGYIGDRSSNLVELIGAERISRGNYKYEGTYYVTKDGETYDSKDMKTLNLRRTGVSFYEVSNWIYNEKKGIYEPIIRRIVIIEKKEHQLTLDL